MSTGKGLFGGGWFCWKVSRGLGERVEIFWPSWVNFLVRVECVDWRWRLVIGQIGGDVNIT